MADLAAASREIESRYGLASIEGGRHGDWGTANRIVPLGEAYLELVSVVDEAQAARSPFGSWVAEAQSALTKPLGLYMFRVLEGDQQPLPRFFGPI